MRLPPEHPDMLARAWDTGFLLSTGCLVIVVVLLFGWFFKGGKR